MTNLPRPFIKIAAALTVVTASLTATAQTPAAPASLCVNGKCAATSQVPGKIKWHPGVGMASVVFTCLGNTNNGAGNAAQQKAIEIAALRAGPSKVQFYQATYFWRALNNTQGVIDGSVNGSNLDQDYALVTGYQSGNGPAGTAVYNAPRRLAMAIINSDYFSPNPTARMLPDWVANNSAYGPVGPDGVHYGYFTTVGQAPGGGDGLGYGSVNALWRAPVLQAYESFFQALANHVLPDGYTVDTSPYIEALWLMGEMDDVPANTAGANEMAADPTFTSESAYVANLEALGGAAVGYFPHTTVMLANNYIQSAAPVVALSQYMSVNRIGWMAGDTMGYSGGQNVYKSTLTFGQALYMGLLPPVGANPWLASWAPGGRTYKGISPYYGEASGFDMGAYAPQDIFNQGLAIGYTHYAFAYMVGSNSTTNWLGSASSMASWNAATSGGVLAVLVNNNLTNTACPSSYTTGCNPN